MKSLNVHINEAWSGVKKHTNNVEIEAWCEEMDISIKLYTINSKGEIDVNGDVDLTYRDFKELPYKFGRVYGWFDMGGCQNLTSLKNCPNRVGDYFGCDRCPKLESLEGCPKEVGRNFYCDDCKRRFTIKEVKSLCKVRGDIVI